jgi:DNA-binding Lrp family transcriptional regulator
MQGKERQLVNINTIAERLDIDIERKKINQLYRERDMNEMSFKQSLYWILACLIDSNFRAQQFKISQNNKRSDIAHHLLNGTNNSDNGFHNALKRLHNEAEKQGMDSFSYAESVLRDGVDYIKTGSYYLAKKLNISQSKANRLLNEMEKDGMIKRSVKKIHHNLPRTNESFRFLKSTTEGTIIPTKKNGFIEVLGSEIMLPINKNGKPKMFFDKNEVEKRQNASVIDTIHKCRQELGLNAKASFNKKINSIVGKANEKAKTIQLNLSNDLPTPSIAEIKEVAVNVEKQELVMEAIEPCPEPVQTTEINNVNDKKEELINQIRNAIKNEKASARREDNILFIETESNPEYLAIGLRQTIEGTPKNIVYEDAFGLETASSIPAEYIAEWIVEKVKAKMLY